MSSMQPTSEAPRPLAGVRVLEMGQLIAGPFAGCMLAYFGAEGDQDRASAHRRPAAQLARAQGRHVAVVARDGTEQEVHYAEPARAPGPGAGTRSRAPLGRAHRELQAGNDGEVGPRPGRASDRGPGARVHTGIGLRADRPLRGKARLRIGVRRLRRIALHQRISRRAAGASQPEPRRHPSRHCTR